MQRDGVFREMKQRRPYEKPSERKSRERADAIRRGRKLARKKAQREGLIPMAKKKLMDDKRGRRPGLGGGDRGGMGDGGGFRRRGSDRALSKRANPGTHSGTVAAPSSPGG